ncbi:MAG: lipopolysaccharide biosynthesis protein [Balneola sp.]
MSLKSQASKGFFWVAIERFGQQILQSIIFVILARLLSPEDYGLIAMLMIFFAIGQTFVDSGMGQALIRKEEITDQDRSTVFWFNLMISIIFYAILYFCAPAIADFYDRAELVDLTRVMGLSIIFFGIAIVQRSEMTQLLEFKKQAYAQIPAMIIAGVVSVTMAFNGYGVWALATQYILISLCSSIMLWILQPAKITFKFSKSSFDELFGFGYKLLISGFIDTIYQHIYKLVIGKYFIASTLGYYTQAKKVQILASKNLVTIIQKVTYPLLAKAGKDPKRLKRGYRQVLQVSSFVIFPGMLMLLILAKPIIIFVLGGQWAPAIPYLQILCISGLLYHLHAINLNILKVLGRSDLFLKLEIIKKINVTIAIIIGIRYGIYGLLIGQVISSYIALFVNTYYTAKFLDYSILEQVQDVLNILMLSLPMALIVGVFSYFLPAQNIIFLFGYLALSGAIYIIVNLIIKPEIVTILLSLISKYVPKKIKTMFDI